MLKMISRKLCPLLSLALATVGCGKSITEGNIESGQIFESQDLPSALVLKLVSNESKQKIYQIPRNANIYLPEKLKMSEGNAIGKTVVITYNLKEDSADEFDYQCTYNSTVTPSELPLLNCTNNYGEIFSEVTSFEFPIYYGRMIKMELQQEASDLVIDAIYTADWK